MKQHSLISCMPDIQQAGCLF